MYTTLASSLLLALPALAAPSPVAPRAGKVQYAGVNIAGFDFGCGIDGTCNTIKITAPLSSTGGPDGIGQMQHFVKDDHMNIFRLPVGWQYLVNNNLGGNLDGNNIQKYDQLVQGCLATGASCIVDVSLYRPCFPRLKLLT